MATTTTTQWILELVDKITDPIKSIGDSVGNTAINLQAVSQSVNELQECFAEIVEPGAVFDAALKDVQAITGVTGDALDDLGDRARRTAINFGGEASDMLESYKGILSRLGPAIAEDQEALDAMGVNVATLSKTMGNDATGAMDALTTAMLQFRVDLEDPQAAAEEMTRMMNVMAAGAKEGASEVPQISQALKVSGTEATKANVSFVEVNAALQELAKGGKVGSEAGTALRNVLGKMAGIDVIPKEAQEKLAALGVNYSIVADKTLPFTDRLRELKKAQGDATIMAQVFGTENAAAAEILLNSVDAQDALAAKITDTSTATEQADIVMSGWTETQARVHAWFTDLAIGVFDVTSKMSPFIDATAGAISGLANLANARQGVVMLFNFLKTAPVIGNIVTGAFGLMSTGAKMFGVAIMNIPIVGWIAAIIVGLVALGKYFWETSSEFRGVMYGMWESVKTVFTGMGEFISEVAAGIWHILKGVFNPANWVDSDYNFSDGLDRITDAAKTYGQSIGKAYNEGKQEGLEDYYAEYPEEDPANQTEESGAKTPQKKSEIKSISPTVTPGSLVGGNATTNNSSSTTNSSSSSIKNITQKITVTNHFTIGAGDNKTHISSIAEKVVAAINGKLQDSMAVMAQ